MKKPEPFAARLKRLRLSAGMTQYGLAKLGLTKLGCRIRPYTQG